MQAAWRFAGDGACSWEPAARRLIVDDDPRGCTFIEDPSADELELHGQQRMRFSPRGVQMTFESWRAAVSRNLRRIADALGRASKTGRSLGRQAFDFELCGEYAERSVCTSCGTEKTMIAASCNVRLCGFCEGVRSRAETAALVEKLEELAKQGRTWRNDAGEYRAYRLSLVTFTERFDPYDFHELAGDRLREKRARLLRLAGDCFDQVLARDDRGHELPGCAMRWALEMPYGGSLHLHALVWAPFVDRERIAGMRQLLSLEVPHELNVDVATERPARAKKGKSRRGIIREACKYLTKGSGARRSAGRYAREQTSTRMDPALAAIVVASFNRLHTSGSRGALRGIETRAAELEETIGDDAKKCECGKSGCYERRWVPRRALRWGDVVGVGRFRVDAWGSDTVERAGWKSDGSAAPYAKRIGFHAAAERIARELVAGVKARRASRGDPDP